MLRAEVLGAMLYGRVTWIPRACHYYTLRRAHHRFLTCCIGWRKHNRADHPISYLDTLIKTESESIGATLRRRQILFAGFVARVRGFWFEAFTAFRSAAQSLVESFYYRTLQIETGERGEGVREGIYLRGDAPISNSPA